MELFDEENTFTAEADLYDSWLERHANAEGMADARADVLRRELSMLIGQMLERVLSPVERACVTMHYGIGREQAGIEEMSVALGIDVATAAKLLAAAHRKLRESDEAIDLWRYLH